MPAIAIEKKNLDLNRDRAGLERVDVWKKPYNAAEIIHAYDEAISELNELLHDPDRKGKQTWPLVLVIITVVACLQIWKALL